MNYRSHSNTFHFEEDTFGKSAKGESKSFPEVLLLKKFLQTKHQVKSLNKNFLEFYYSVK